MVPGLTVFDLGPDVPLLIMSGSPSEWLPGMTTNGRFTSGKYQLIVVATANMYLDSPKPTYSECFLSLVWRICAFGNRYEAIPVEALCLVLIRLAYPVRLLSLCDIFGHSRGWLSSIYNDTIIYLHRRWASKLHWNAEFLTRERLWQYNTAIKNAGCGDCYWGYIDGTARRICRPEEEQRDWYSGHKRIHCWKGQSVVTPDGLIASFAGPYVGKRADMWMVQESGIQARLREVFPSPILSIFIDTLLVISSQSSARAPILIWRQSLFWYLRYLGSVQTSAQSTSYPCPSTI